MSEGMVSGDAAVALAFTAYERGKSEVTTEPQRIRMNADSKTPFDLIVHGVVTADRLRRISRLILACADIVEEGDSEDAVAPTQPKETGHD